MQEHVLLKGTHFKLARYDDKEMHVTDPWGTNFRIFSSNKTKDSRGVQNNIDNGESLGNCMDNLTIYTPPGANIAGIARFYEKAFVTPILDLNGHHCVVSTGPYQSLTFQRMKQLDKDINMHVDLRDEPEQKILRVNSITQATTVRTFQSIFVTLDPRTNGQMNWGSPTSILASREGPIVNRK